VNLVIDASVLVKAFVPENGSEEAGSLLARAEAAEVDLIAPELIYPETANILWKKVRRNELTTEEAREIAEAVLTVPIREESASSLLLLALDIALTCGITAYDAQYVALAETFDCQLVTADHKLVASLEGTDFSGRMRRLTGD
jgi:predicted nucleic acid-binding protein